MKAHLTAFALSVVLIASIGMAPAFGQIVEPITVAVDKESYSGGEKIIVTGEVRNTYGIPVIIQISDPMGSIVGVEQITVGADKQFSKEFTAGGAMRLEGAYKVLVQYGEPRSASTTFQFVGTTSPTTPPKDVEVSKVTATTVTIKGATDLIGYEIVGGKLLGIIPSAMTLTLNIEATDDGSIKLTIPRSIFESQDKNGTDIPVFVLIDDTETSEVEETAAEKSRTLTIGFPAGATKIDLVGTWAIPEFGAVAAMVLAVAVIAIIAVSARSRLSIMPR